MYMIQYLSLCTALEQEAVVQVMLDLYLYDAPPFHPRMGEGERERERDEVDTIKNLILAFLRGRLISKGCCLSLILRE